MFFRDSPKLSSFFWGHVGHDETVHARFRGCLKKLFQPKKQESVYDKFRQTMDPLIIKTYRNLGKHKQSAPTAKTSDAEILEIYTEVLTKFKEASRAKGQELPAPTINYIAFYFLNIYEDRGKTFYDEHLAYELMKYNVSGLRQSYVGKELSFF